MHVFVVGDWEMLIGSNGSDYIIMHRRIKVLNRGEHKGINVYRTLQPLKTVV
jgi:hypothetical protein